jgi:Cytotoxic
MVALVNYRSRPSPCFLDEMKAFGVRGGRRVWRDSTGERFYTWDGLHGEIEVFNRRGRHLGAADAVSGVLKKPADRTRRLDV